MSEIERDARVDAAWKAASRDEPPAALDAAIRAAARQAVSSKPRRARDKHWWYPFAAAATVAVIAVGLLQVTPPEQVAPTLDAIQAMKQETVPVPAVPPRPAMGSTSLATPAPPAPSGAPAEPAPLKKDRRASDGGRAAGLVQNAQRERAAADTVAQSGPSTAANKPAQVQDSPPAPVPASPPPVAARRADAFPGAQQAAAQSGVTHRDAATPANPSGALAASESAATPSSAVPESRSELSGARTEESRPQRQAMLTANAAKVKTATPRSAEEWIKLIRALRNEGRIDEASKELVAFRSAYGERADSLLPQDLREFEARTTVPAAK